MTTGILEIIALHFVFGISIIIYNRKSFTKPDKIEFDSYETHESMNYTNSGLD